MISNDWKQKMSHRAPIAAPTRKRQLKAVTETRIIDLTDPREVALLRFALLRVLYLFLP
jgi:hypothetical protein